MIRLRYLTLKKISPNNILVVCISLILSLLISEGIVRFLKIAPDVFFIEERGYQLSNDYRIGYEPVPYEIYRSHERRNSLGFRDSEHTKEIQDTFRAVFIGDSLTEGILQGDPQNRYTEILARKLRKSGNTIDIINMGVSGYNTMQEVETLKEKGLQFNPNLVVLQYCINDRGRNDGEIFNNLILKQQKTKGISKTQLNQILGRSALYRLISFRIFPQLAFQNRSSTYEFLEKDSVFEALSLLSDLSKRHDFKVLVAYFPYFNPERSGEETSLKDRNEIRKIVMDLGMEFFDLTEPMLACQNSSKSPVTISDYLHLTDLGERCAADAISDSIQQFLN